MTRRPDPNLPPYLAPQALPADPLAATIRDLSGWWLEVRCDCGQIAQLPLRLMCAKLHPHTPAVSAVASRLKCEKCKGRPASVKLFEWAGGNPLMGPAPKTFQVIG